MVHRNIIQLLAAIPGHAEVSAHRQNGYKHHPSPERDLMKIHEYQGKEILRSFGVPVPRGIPAFT
ncbi:MAG: hypothetical protein KA970_14365, partial [Alicycliphilus sp.]|nr:hypothetical protein [Alicycliphilus sp.]